MFFFCEKRIENGLKPADCHSTPCPHLHWEAPPFAAFFEFFASGVENLITDVKRSDTRWLIDTIYRSSGEKDRRESADRSRRSKKSDDAVCFRFGRWPKFAEFFVFVSKCFRYRNWIRMFEMSADGWFCVDDWGIRCSDFSEKARRCVSENSDEFRDVGIRLWLIFE